jgi:hypothetical protein
LSFLCCGFIETSHNGQYDKPIIIGREQGDSLWEEMTSYVP